MTVRILLADDHPIIRSGIKNFLDRVEDFQVIAEAEDGQQVLDLINNLDPDVLVLDLRLPELSGVEVVEQLKADGARTKILILSGYWEWDLVGRCLNAGVAGYLTKDEPVDVIIDAVRGIAAGQTGWMSRKVKAALMNVYQQEEKPRAKKLSRREVEVCEKIAEGKTNKQIAFELSLSEKTIEKYVYSLFHKLEVDSRVQLAVIKIRENME